MAKKFFKQWLQPLADIKSHPNLQCFGELLHDPNLWHLNRRSLSGGMAVGLFFAFLPMPMQMIGAAAGAIFFRVNLPLSVALVWITNPFTMAPVFYAAYKIGTFLMGIHPKPMPDNVTFDWIFNTLETIWQPFLLGSLVLGTMSAALGYLTVRIFWRLQVNRLWQIRREQRLKKKLLIENKD